MGLAEVGDSVAQSYGKAKLELVGLTEAELGRIAIQDLGKALSENEITIEDHNNAMSSVLTTLMDIPAHEVEYLTALATLRKEFDDDQKSAGEFALGIISLNTELNNLRLLLENPFLIQFETSGTFPSGAGFPSPSDPGGGPVVPFSPPFPGGIPEGATIPYTPNTGPPAGSPIQ